jgi:nitrile hydratase subunit beta
VNGVHDIGGMDGFGPVRPEPGEPVFHEPWEGRVFAITITGAGQPRSTLDAGRHRLERLDPVVYLASSYYERWLAALETGLIDAGTLTADEIEARAGQFAANPDTAPVRRDDPAVADRIAAGLRAGNPATRPIRRQPRFAAGDPVVTRNLNPHGHTRLPRYARGKRGVVARHHGAHVFPDSNAHGLGENPQHLYSVRISARELWGGAAEPNESILIDLWESYLDKDAAPSKSVKRKGR